MRVESRWLWEAAEKGLGETWWGGVDHTGLCRGVCSRALGECGPGTGERAGALLVTGCGFQEAEGRSQGRM